MDLSKRVLILFPIILIIFLFVLIGCSKEEIGPEAIKEEPEEGVANVEQEGSAVKEGKVTFITEDDVKISGNIFGTGKKWVILTHMLQADQQSWFDFAEFLKENGYTVLTYDLRGIGRSGGSMYQKGVENIFLDLEAALDFVRQYNPEKIFLIGAVVGGTSSLKVASKEPVDGVVSISGLEEYQGLSVIDEIVNVAPPKLFIVSSGDPNVESTDTLYEKSPNPKDIQVLEGNELGTSMLKDTSENSEKVKQIILDFLNRS